jgi:hypothetical protein
LDDVAILVLAPLFFRVRGSVLDRCLTDMLSVSALRGIASAFAAQLNSRRLLLLFWLHAVCTE